MLYERALALLPGSYKLWHAYLNDRIGAVRGRSPSDPRLEVVNNTFERALVFMHKMPVIWIEYCSFLVEQRRVTRTRRTFDRALQALPVTQHERVWPLYLAFVRAAGVPETALRVYRRHLQFDTAGREDFIDYLLSIDAVDEAAAQLAAAVNDEAHVSPTGRTKHALWMMLCDVVARHPGQITSLRVDPVLRSGIARFSDEVGRLWCALAEFYVRSGAFEKARDVYEEAMVAVRTVRDFATVFDAAAQFEEAMLTAKLELLAVKANNSGGDPPPAGSPDPAIDDVLSERGDDTELRIARLELLMDRRPLLLSSVLLRQNPHNVHEWHKRAALLIEGGAAPARVVAMYTEAVRTVDPWQAIGSPHTLWVAFAKYYEAAGDGASARVVFREAVTADFRSGNDLAALYCEWAELELRAGRSEEALRVVEGATRGGGGKRRGNGGHGRGDGEAADSATASDPNPASHRGGAARSRVSRNAQLWSLYLDLEEALGTPTTVTAAYERCITLGVATPAMILNWATYLEEHHFFEESFRAYERGVAAFPWPHVKDVWLAYLRAFVARFGGSKVERARELFEQAVTGIPAAEAATFYRLYAAFEEAHGLMRHAMAVWDRATRAVDESHRYETYLAYIRKAEEAYGAPRTREIYEAAIDALPESQVRDMCLRFAATETRLGEVDRARAIYAHASQYCDPRVSAAFWAEWSAFEVSHGNEATFREMLRIKRAVGATYSTVNYGLQDLLNKDAESATKATHDGTLPIDVLQTSAAEVRPRPLAQPPPAKLIRLDAGAAPSTADVAPTDSSEIALDDTVVGVAQVPVPESVFGGLRAPGALERFRNAAKAPV